MARLSIAEKRGADWGNPGALGFRLSDFQTVLRGRSHARTAFSWRRLLARLSPDRLVERLYRLRPYGLERRRWQDAMRWTDAPPAVRDVARTGLRRLWAERALTLIARNLLIGLTLILGAVVFDTLFAAPIVPSLALVLALVFLVRGLIQAVLARPTTWQTLRAVDLRKGTRQQLATALELVHLQSSGVLADRQRAAAIATARSVAARGGFRIRYPWRELKFATALLVGSAAIVAVQPMIDLGVLRGRSASDPTAQELARIQSLEAELGISLSDSEAIQNRQPSNIAEAVQQLLNRLFNPAAAAEQTLADLSSATSTIQEQYTSSILQEAALAQLAEAWKPGAATREVADALERGDYQAAATAMDQLGERLPELSPDARQQVADGLKQAADRSAALDQALSSVMQQAGRSVETGDDRSARDQLSQLSQATRDVGEQVGSRDALADALDSLSDGQMAIRDALGDPTGQLADMDTEAAAQQQAANGSQGGQEGQSGQPGAQPNAALGSAQAGGLLGQSKSGNSPQNGNRDLNTAEGESVNVRPPGLGGDTVEPGAPDPNAIPTRGSGGNRAVEPGYQGKVVTPPDSNLIPWNLRPVLRRYFSQPEPKQ